METKASKFNDNWQAIEGFFASGGSWKAKDYFVQVVHDQHGLPVCATTSVGYLVEFYQSRLRHEQVPIEMTAFVDRFAKKSAEEKDEKKVTDVIGEIEKADFPIDDCHLIEEVEDIEWVTPIAPGIMDPPTVIDMVKLLKDGPFITVVRVGQKFRSYKHRFGLESTISYYSPGESDQQSVNRHVLMVIGYRKCVISKQDHFLVKNSWGNTWGHEGYAWVKYSEANPMQFGHEIHTIKWN